MVPNVLTVSTSIWYALVTGSSISFALSFAVTTPSSTTSPADARTWSYSPIDEVTVNRS